MTLILSAKEIEQLQSALRTLLTPWEHDRPDDWCRAACRAVRETLAVDSAVVIRSGNGEPAVVADGAISTDALHAYKSDWWGQLVGERRRWARALRAWVREDVWPKDEVTRSAYYNEYCIPVGFRDSAGMSTSGRQDEQIALYVASERQNFFSPEGRERMLLTLLQPGLEAGARALSRFEAPKRILDALDVPTALVDLTGKLIHTNRGFAELMKRPASEAEVLQAVRHLSVQVGRATQNSARTRGAVSPVVTWHSADGRLSLEAALWESTGLPCGPLCVLSATHSPSVPDAATIRRTWGLTQREADVASLLARGCRNREIANALSISEHTARRHTERVLRKMGADTRAQVAAMVGRSGDPTTEKRRLSAAGA